MKKPLLIALIAFVGLLFLFVKRTSGFIPVPKPKPTPSPAPVDDDYPEETNIIYKGACDWAKFPTTGCDPTRGWCKKDKNMCTTDFTESPTYGKPGGLCITDEDCNTSGAKCIVTYPQTLFGKCSK